MEMLQYLCWAELFLASYLNPRASFLGHLAGIAAGLIHVQVCALRQEAELMKCCCASSLSVQVAFIHPVACGAAYS